MTSLARELAAEVAGEVRFDAGSRAAYSTDASNYRQVPIGVVVPETVDAAVAAIGVCRRYGVPVLSRGGGTSLAGECCNVAVVLDWSKYCTRVVSIDPERRRAVVEPGVVLDVLNERTREHGLVFGPKPSTHGQCTIGGMIGNNSCGSTAQAYGKTVDNISRLEILTYAGERFWVGPTDDDEYAEIVRSGDARARCYGELRALRNEYADDIRRGYPELPRRVSGYNLDSLLPENGFDVARAVVGSESTLVTVLRAEVELVEEPPARELVVLGYPDAYLAADAVPQVNEHDPFMVEGLDRRLVEFQHSKQMHPLALADLPDGDAWLMVEFGGRDQEEANRRAADLCAALRTADRPPAMVRFDDPVAIARLWAVRESGLGATARVPGEPDTWPGWEDSAVPPERFGAYLRDFDELLDRYGFGMASRYGHFGHGCLHIRIPFDLVSAAGVAAYRSFVTEAADLVVRYGGSLSGEHGDGQARGELLTRMYGDRLVRAMEQLKAIFDPGNRMNPGKVVAPYRLDENLRLGRDYAPAQPSGLFFQYPHDDGSFERAALRCVGVGNCRQDKGGVMCPSYRATREEEHSTRGRARLLFEMLQGDVIKDGWRSDAVNDALDLCLACKGCKTDCPVDVDMATYKAEFLAHHYRHRLRPADHYSMGWLPLWARVASVAPRVVNRATSIEPVAKVAKRIGGVAVERPIPAFAPQQFRDWFRRRPHPSDAQRGTVVLWPDTFTNYFNPEVGRAAVEVLEAAGYRVAVPPGALCCGLTWISTGQLATAKRVLRRTVDALAPALRRGCLVVGLEPSCAAVFRADAAELFPNDLDVGRLKRQTRTLAELLTADTADWQPPAVGGDAIAQPHCHQHAVLGFAADQEVLRRSGVRTEVLDVGCCGLAGNFGFTEGHFDVSMACAEHGWLPAVREAEPSTAVLADGFSCRTQVEHAGVGRQAVHLAELLAGGLRGLPLHDYPERDVARRPVPPRTADMP